MGAASVAEFIAPALVAKARKAVVEASGPLVIGYDPAWTGDARHAMAFRRGRRVIEGRHRLWADSAGERTRTSKGQGPTGT